MKGTSVWILINKNHRHFSHKPGVITMFTCQYKAAMIAHYELDPEEEWQFQEVIASEELFFDSYINFL